METALLVLSVAFAAFCIWLTVRIVNRRERWAKWTLAAVVIAPALYVMSDGPAFWLVRRAGRPAWALTAYRTTYAPLQFAYSHGPRPVHHAIQLMNDFWDYLESE
jgi:cytochrome bd-type quinol oxidase subunit 2